MIPPTNPMIATDLSSPSDDELLARIGAGDDNALGVLLSRHNELVFQWCLRKLGNRSDAENILLETCYAFWKSIASGKSVRNPVGLMMTIARRRCVDFVRRKNRKKGDDTHRVSTSDDVFPDLADPFQALDQLHSRVQIVLDSMDEKDQIIGYHYFLLDPRPSLKEIGEIVHLDPGNVHRRLNGIRERLKDELDDFG